MVMKIKRFCNNHKKEILNIVTGVTFFILTYFMFANEEITFTERFVGWIFLYLISVIFIYIVNCKPNYKELPTLRKRLTELDDDGRIRIKRENLEKAITYLYELEEYLNM